MSEQRAVKYKECYHVSEATHCVYVIFPCASLAVQSLRRSPIRSMGIVTRLRVVIDVV
jgi:hypothetical protein